MTIQQLEHTPLQGALRAPGTSDVVHHGWIPAASGSAPIRGGTATVAKQLAVTTRAMDEDDAMLLFELYASARADEISRSGWVTPQQRSFFREQAQTQERHFYRHHEHLVRRTICINGFSAGRLLVDRTDTGFTLVDMGLLPAFRGRGIGTLLIQDLLVEAADADVPVKITISKKNPAARLCERLGFGHPIDLGDRWHFTWHATR